MKNNKAQGNDNILSEFLENGSKLISRVFYKLISLIWREEQILVSWKEGVMVPLHKKGEKMYCSNYRGIFLINTGYKVLSLIFIQRLSTCVKNQIGD